MPDSPVNTPPTRLSLIVAYARNRTIGRDNKLPWRLPPDLAHFKRTTLGHPVIMGRRTWESLPGGALPGRHNVVVSRNPGYVAAGASVATSLEQAVALVANEGEAFVIGGEQLYRLALPLASRLVATELGVDVEGDAVFPPLPEEWVEVERLPQPPHGELPYDFVTYRRS